jgi:hypothetical protein
MVAAVVSTYLIGVVGCFCTPRLPFGKPQRGFDLVSWMMEIKSGKLDVVPAPPGDPEKVEDQTEKVDWGTDVPLEEAEKSVGEMKLAYSV